MALKRMFSKTITNSDAFLDMGLSTQALYFHLNMNADDDGFVGNAKRIMRMIGANDDELKVLLAKSFLISFEGGVCVIKHWLIHNTLKNDRIKETNYTDLKAKLSLKNNKSYTLDPKCVQDVSIDKTRLDKISLDKTSNNGQVDPDFFLFWQAYPNRKKKKEAIRIWSKLKPDITKCLQALSWQKDTEQWRKGIIPHPTTWLNNAQWEDEPIKKIYRSLG